MANEDQGGFSLNPLVLYNRLKASFADFLKNAGAILTLLLGAENITLDKVGELETEFEALVMNFQHLLEQIKEFKFDPKWNSRVINVPRAIEAGKMFWSLITTDFRDRIKAIAEPFKNFKVEIATLKEGLAARSVDSPTGVARAVNQMENTVRAVNGLIGNVDAELKALQNFEDLLQKITDELESLDDLFLPQGKPKRLVDISYRKRVG